MGSIGLCFTFVKSQLNNRLQATGEERFGFPLTVEYLAQILLDPTECATFGTVILTAGPHSDDSGEFDLSHAIATFLLKGYAFVLEENIRSYQRKVCVKRNQKELSRSPENVQNVYSVRS